MRFQDLNIEKNLVEKLNDKYIKTPTEVQEKVIPEMLKKKNIIVKSQTGTGKTLAFVLPIVQNLDKNLNLPQVMILTPTRELANQIEDVISYLVEKDEVKIALLVGGHGYDKQEARIKTSQIIVGTPGRILDHISKGNINLKYLSSIIIDEADQMLAYDFLEDIEMIANKSPEKIGYALFSATMPTKIISLSKKIIKNPVKINISEDGDITENVKQVFVKLKENLKYNAFKILAEILNPFMAIVFCSSKEEADTLYKKLALDGYSVDITHGDFSQKKREQTLNNFRKMKFVYLVTTDLSARGFDIEGVTHVINYSLPTHSTYYVHRIGRTGRMDNSGISISFVTEKDKSKEERILRKIKTKYKVINYKNDRDEYNYKNKLNEIKENI